VTLALGELVAVSVAVAATRSRLAKLELLATFLRRLDGATTAVVVPWLVGELRQGKIGLGWAAVREVTAGAPPPPEVPLLDVAAVDSVFTRLAELSGPGSQRARGEMLAALWRQATAGERELLARLLTGELRQGALAGLLGEAVARATDLPATAVRRAVMLAGDLAAVAVAALAHGAAGLAAFRLELGRPLLPMLASPAAAVEEVLSELAEGEQVAFEWKLDGARVQVHRDGDEVRVFSRQQNEVTAAVPEIVAAVRSLPVARLVLDGEAIALGPEGRPLPFQVTMRRFGRRLEVAAAQRELPLTAFAFDLLHLEGEDLLDRPARERWTALAAVAGGLVVPRLVTTEVEAAEAFYAEAVARGHEGLMAKILSSPYEAGARGASWRKLKPAHTLDLVVLAAEWGSGRRQGWLSNLHLGARDPAPGGFVMLGKTFKGLTDELLAWQTRELLAREVARDDWTVYVRPELVVEIALNEVQESPHYPAGMALRFARVRRYRADKTAAEADTVDQVRALFARSGGRVAPGA
jgi:DNA ligase-1